MVLHFHHVFWLHVWYALYREMQDWQDERSLLTPMAAGVLMEEAASLEKMSPKWTDLEPMLLAGLPRALWLQDCARGSWFRYGSSIQWWVRRLHLDHLWKELGGLSLNVEAKCKTLQTNKMKCCLISLKAKGKRQYKINAVTSTLSPQWKCLDN